MFLPDLVRDSEQKDGVAFPILYKSDRSEMDSPPTATEKMYQHVLNGREGSLSKFVEALLPGSRLPLKARAGKP